MPEHVVCPNCFDGCCGECTGSGCYCDCQIPIDQEVYLTCEFGHDEIDECDECCGCRECGTCYCGEDVEDEE